MTRNETIALIVALILALVVVTAAALYAEQWMTTSQKDDKIRECQYVESECPEHD